MGYFFFLVQFDHSFFTISENLVFFCYAQFGDFCFTNFEERSFLSFNTAYQNLDNMNWKENKVQAECHQKKCFKQGYWVFQLLNREQNTNLHYPFSIPSAFIWMYTSSYHVQHEAGHFLVAYLLGVLPKGYTITSLDTLSKQGSLNVQAGTAFVDYEFLEEVSSINFWKKYYLQILDNYSL